MTKRGEKTWFKAEVAPDGAADISIFSEIGGWGVTIQDFHASLKALGKRDEMRLSISSPGGDVFTGFAIFNLLDSFKATKTVRIEGLAASMASVIAMVGDEIIMPSNAMMMIHNPFGLVMGGATEVKAFSEALGKMRKNILETYAARTALSSLKSAASKDELSEMMNNETWLSAADARNAGLATKVVKAAAFNMAGLDLSRFSNVPAGFGRNLRSLAMAKKPVVEVETDEDESAVAVKTEAEIRAEVVAQNKEVRALCKLAGKPEAADAYIEAGKSVAEVIADLGKKAEAAAKGGGTGTAAAGTEVSATHAISTDGSTTPEIDADKIYARYNAARRRAA